MKLSFVLLIKIRSHHTHNELDRLKDIQLKSFRRFLDLSLLQDFFIVASREDIEAIKPELLQSYPEFPFVFIAEEDLCPTLKGCPGWTKQMILKLAVANLVETDYYLTLDTDVFLTKPLSHEDILAGGKLPYQREAPGSHRSWWKSSSGILQVQADPMLNARSVMGVTPEYLVTDICRSLQREIETLHGTEDFASWLMKHRMSKKNLLNKVLKKLSESFPGMSRIVPRGRMAQITFCDWTEYTLYWTYLNKLGLQDKYYTQDDRQVYGNCIWVAGDIEAKDLRQLVEKAFRDNAAYHFSLIQSSIKKLEPSYLAELVGSYLK